MDQQVGESYCAGELISSPVQRWIAAEKLALLDWHPMFTSRCPNCEVTIAFERSQSGWKCNYCNWEDDSI